ncbi:MAG: hypothetical protein ACFBSF_15625 [Leptolyngbyaceae cyanobacterium]
MTQASCLVTFDGASAFEVVAGVIGEEVGADQQQNNVGGIEPLVDDLGGFVTGEDLAVALVGDDVLTLEQGEMIGELGLRGFVSRG